MRTALLVLYSLALAAITVFLLLDRVAVYPTDQAVVRVGLNIGMGIFNLALLFGGWLRWKWTLVAGLIYLLLVFAIDSIGAITQGVSVHWPGLVFAALGLPFLVLWLIEEKNNRPTSISTGR